MSWVSSSASEPELPLARPNPIPPASSRAEQISADRGRAAAQAASWCLWGPVTVPLGPPPRSGGLFPLPAASAHPNSHRTASSLSLCCLPGSNTMNIWHKLHKALGWLSSIGVCLLRELGTLRDPPASPCQRPAAREEQASENQHGLAESLQS